MEQSVVIVSDRKNPFFTFLGSPPTPSGEWLSAEQDCPGERAVHCDLSRRIHFNDCLRLLRVWICLLCHQRLASHCLPVFPGRPSTFLTPTKYGMSVIHIYFFFCNFHAPDFSFRRKVRWSWSYFVCFELLSGPSGAVFTSAVCLQFKSRGTCLPCEVCWMVLCKTTKQPSRLQN